MIVLSFARLVPWIASALLLGLATVPAAPGEGPAWVSTDRSGRLVYDVDAQGNRIPDFSHAGYGGGGVAIPAAPVRVVVPAQSGDATARIQRAIDQVSELPRDASGLRGAVLLLRGRHDVHGALRITASGVVLRGQGRGEGGTVLVALGKDRRTLIRVTGRADRRTERNDGWRIGDEYVPVGARSFRLESVEGLRVGDSVLVQRPSTKEWIERLGATDFGGGIGWGWKPGSRDILWDRRITAIDGAVVTVDAPITTALERDFGGGWVARYDWPGRITQVGIENLELSSEFDRENPKDETHAWMAITLESCADAWVRQVTFRHFAGSAVAVYETSKRVTVKDCLSLEPVSEVGGYRRHTFFTMGQQTLFLRCHAEEGRYDFAVGHASAGPNAFVQCEAVGALADSGPIESWASGVLYDNVTIDGNALTLGFRAGSGAAIGWAAANSVLWQCSAAVIRCSKPPTAQNWAFGSWATFEGDGHWRGSNELVTPDSLYAAQLRDRLGAEAMERLQLRPLAREGATNPSLERAQELAAEAHRPAQRLAEFIAGAAARDPIPSEPGTAPNVDEVPDPRAAVPAPRSPVVLTTGWLTVDGKLLIGGTERVAWWQGRIEPGAAASFGPSLTRFVPGRIGPGWTDDLEQVAESMVERGLAALDHHHGLWYDRRRDDHQRVRRMDGDVRPPFFEQPFARSGRGTAWDGLSRYDLTRPNPWYWSRLREFGDICLRRGLVLFHQNYFQHSILEAGAHWADFPWRTANNINDTGFPEPPVYAGGKRIFMAEPFYDGSHPVRRDLHERYIRQCLDAFGDNPNVIQLTSAEFTGPQHFVELWIDTIAAWEEETGVRTRVALSATKDVQDAILADPRRRDIVDAIDFRYWWRTERGEFAPPGGHNLSPRQFERRWRGGRPTDASLAGMAAEYRRRFPNKVLLCDFADAGWAWLCAGGSLPRLPPRTDAALLTAIPRMAPCPGMSRDGQWVLREAGRQLLIHRVAGGDMDLTPETGTFRVHAVDVRTGSVAPRGTVMAGRAVTLPGDRIIWLTRD